MNYLTALNKATDNNFIFPVHIAFKGIVNRQSVFSQYDKENLDKLSLIDRKSVIYGVQVLRNREITEKAKKSGAYNESTVEVFADFIHKVALLDNARREILGNNYADFAAMQSTSAVIFLPANENIARTVFDRVYKWLADNDIMNDSKFNPELVLRILMSGFPVYGENNVDKAVDTVIKEIMAGRIYRDVDDIFLSEEESLHSNKWHDYSPMSRLRLLTYDLEAEDNGVQNLGCETLYTRRGDNSSCEKENMRNIFNQILPSLPHFVVINEFMQHGVKNQSLAEFCTSDKGKKTIAKHFKTGDLNIYKHTKNLYDTMCLTKNLNKRVDFQEHVSFLSMHKKNVSLFKEVIKLDKKSFMTWVKNRENQPEVSVDDLAKKERLNLWLNYVTNSFEGWSNKKQSPQQAIDKIEPKLTKDELKETKTEIFQHMKTYQDKKRKFTTVNIDNIERIVGRMHVIYQRFHGLKVYKTKENECLEFLLKKAVLHNNGTKNLKLPFYGYLLLMETFVRPGKTIRSMNAKNVLPTMDKICTVLNYDMEKLSELLYFFYTDKNFPSLGQRNIIEFLENVQNAGVDINTDPANSSTLALYASVFTKNMPQRNYVYAGTNVKNLIMWKKMYNLHQQNPLYIDFS